MGGSATKPAYPPEFSYISRNHFVNNRKQKIYCHYWEPETAPKAAVFIAHGVCEHGEWYKEMAEYLNEHEIMVYSHDHAGHGLSEGQRVHIDSMDDYVNDVVQHAEIVMTKFPDIPLFMIGHSMGGTIALCTSLAHPNLFQGMILIGPAVKPNEETVTPFKKSLARMVSSVAPHFHVGPVQSTWVCRDPAVRKKYDDDPILYHSGLKARWSVVMLDAMAHIQKNMDKLTVPMLCIQGDDDKLCHIDGARELQQNAKCSDKTLEIFEGGYHQIHNEPEGMKERCLKDISDWITERIQQQS